MIGGYQDQAIDFLESALRDHNLKSMVRSQNGDCHFLLAEELEGSRVFLAFRGTEDKKDLTEDLKIYQRCAESGHSCGKFHAGFLTRAEEFPLQKILADQSLQNRSLVIYGHSLGGAISSIVTTEILIEREKRPKEQFPGEVINITFGSPLFGDDTARRFLEEKNFSAKMFHFVVELDPVSQPPLLCSKHLCSEKTRLPQTENIHHRLTFAETEIIWFPSQVDNQIRSLAGTLACQSFYEEKKLLPMATKVPYQDIN